jgi:hypothetical protein
MAPIAHAGRVDARTVLLADDDEDFRSPVELAPYLEVAMAESKTDLVFPGRDARLLSRRSSSNRSCGARFGERTS